MTSNPLDAQEMAANTPYMIDDDDNSIKEPEVIELEDNTATGQATSLNLNELDDALDQLGNVNNFSGSTYLQRSGSQQESTHLRAAGRMRTYSLPSNLALPTITITDEHNISQTIESQSKSTSNQSDVLSQRLDRQMTSLNKFTILNVSSHEPSMKPSSSSHVSQRTVRSPTDRIPDISSSSKPSNHWCQNTHWCQDTSPTRGRKRPPNSRKPSVGNNDLHSTNQGHSRNDTAHYLAYSSIGTAWAENARLSAGRWIASILDSADGTTRSRSR